MKFTNLHAHSYFSLYDGICSPENYVRTCAEYGYTHATLTEHGNLFSAVPLTQACIKEGIQPILGIEAYYYYGDHKERPGAGEKLKYSATHLVLLAENEKGWDNLHKLSTLSFTEGFYYRPRLNPELLKEHSEGIIALSGCLSGALNGPFLAGDGEHAIEQAAILKDIFGKDNFFCEIQDNSIPEQAQANQFIERVAKEFDLNIVLTLDSHYINESDSDAQHTRICISQKKPHNEVDKPPYGEHRLRSLFEIASLNIPKQYIINAQEIADRCKFIMPLGNIRFPSFPAPAGHTPESWFNKEIIEGFNRKYNKIKEFIDETGTDIKEYKKRLRDEIKIIKSTGFLGYFCVVADIVQEAKRNRWGTNAGRGSVGGSLVAYVLDITDTDPIRFNLMFERFLDPNRKSLPDIDIDFSHEDHPKVIEYIKKKYGEDHVGNICTYSRLQARACIKDVGRAMDIPYNVTNTISGLVPQSGRGRITLEHAMSLVPDLNNKLKAYPRLIDHSLKLEGVPRHTSIHAGGLVITPEPLADVAPLFLARAGKDPSKAVAVQMDKDQAEAFGLVKLDCLRVVMIDIVQGALRSIKENTGNDIDLRNIPLDDQRTLDLFRNGDTDGVFQMHSPLMKRLLKDFKPNSVDEIAIVNAIGRPGAEGGVEAIMECRHGKKQPTYILDVLKPVLAPTYGQFVYQEQMIQAARIVGGMTYQEADKLRKACGKKDARLMTEQGDKFTKGALAQGHPKDKVSRLFEIIAKFAEYGFNKSHSTSYSLFGYWTAYLKAHYPQHYIASALTHEGSDEEKLELYLQVAESLGIEILPPDINKSQKGFTVDGIAIRQGLSQIKGLGPASLESIETIRQVIDEKDIYNIYITSRPKDNKNQSFCILFRQGFEYDDIDLLMFTKKISNKGDDVLTILNEELKTNIMLAKQQAEKIFGATNFSIQEVKG